MVATGFAPDNCHASHHATILETLNAVVEHYEQGDTEIISRLAEALVEWFPQHAASMDAGLALHMKEVGFDSRTETLADPDRVRPATMSGCGSVSCKLSGLRSAEPATLRGGFFVARIPLAILRCTMRRNSQPQPRPTPCPCAPS